MALLPVDAMRAKMVVSVRHHRPRPAVVDTSLDSAKQVRNLVLLTASYDPTVVFESAAGAGLCSIAVQVELRNLCNTKDFDLVVVAKNPR
jgi:hypothetical protein